MRSLSSTIVKSISRAFAHPLGKVAAVGLTAVSGAAFEEIGRRSGVVDSLATGGLKLLGIDKPKKDASSPSSSSSSTPPKTAGVGHADAHGDCGCNKPGAKHGEHKCSKCKDADEAKSKLYALPAYRTFVAGVEGLRAAGLEAGIEVGFPCVPTPFGCLPGTGGDDAPPPPQGGGAINYEGKHFANHADYQAFRQLELKAQAQQAAAKRALEAKNRSDSKRIAALQRRMQNVSDQQKRDAMQSQVDTLKAQLASQQAVADALSKASPQAAQPAAQAVLQAAPSGDLSSAIQQITQLKMLESALAPQQQGVDPNQYEYAPWGAPGGGYPQGYGPQDPFEQALEYSLSGGADFEETFDAEGIAEDFEAEVEGNDDDLAPQYDRAADTAGCSTGMCPAKSF